jgi:dienelactone hydrolase
MHVSRNKSLAALLFAVVAAARATAGDDWESFADGSRGQATEFRGAGGLVIPAYVRTPKGVGPFPVIVMLHGGSYRRGASAGMARSNRAPVTAFLQAGWAVYCTDCRPNDKISIEPIETDDTVEAIKAVRKLPFIDGRRVGLWGASHGANVASRVIARADLSGAILCAPAAMDLIEVKKADGRGEPVVPILRKLIAAMEAKHGARAEEIDKDPDKYGYSSALREIDQVRWPLLILNARDDDNAPVSIVERYVGRLRAAGKPVDTYFPGKGGHGFYVGRQDGPEYQEGTERSVAFFTARFKGGPPPEPKKPALDQYGPSTGSIPTARHRRAPPTRRSTARRSTPTLAISSTYRRDMRKTRGGATRCCTPCTPAAARRPAPPPAPSGGWTPPSAPGAWRRSSSSFPTACAAPLCTAIRRTGNTRSRACWSRS